MTRTYFGFLIRLPRGTPQASFAIRDGLMKLLRRSEDSVTSSIPQTQGRCSGHRVCASVVPFLLEKGWQASFLHTQSSLRLAFSLSPGRPLRSQCLRTSTSLHTILPDLAQYWKETKMGKIVSGSERVIDYKGRLSFLRATTEVIQPAPIDSLLELLPTFRLWFAQLDSLAGC